MLTHAELVTLYRSLRDRRVLSVYLDGSADDPALQRSWRLQLDHALDDLRQWLDGSARAERDELERSIGLLQALTASFAAGVGAPGWAAFITSDRVHDAHLLPASAPTLAVWSNGPCVSPYVRSLKEYRPVVIVIGDARHAALYRYHLGELDRADVVRAHHSIDHPEHMGTPARVGFHPGTRGTTGDDAAQRALLYGRDRMIAEVAESASKLAGTDGWILIGGIKRVAARISAISESVAPHRVLRLDSLDVHSSQAEIAAIARAGASRLRDAMDEHRITEIVEAAGAHGLGAIGPVDTGQALAQSSVRDLYLTHRYREDHAAEAEQAVRAAFDQDATVEEVSEGAAELLNRQGGLAAGLRFRASAETGTTAQAVRR